MNILKQMYWRLRYWGRGPIRYEPKPPRPIRDLIAEIDWEEVPILNQLGRDTSVSFTFSKKVGDTHIDTQNEDGAWERKSPFDE